jgi:hypothetical protein
MYDLLRLKNFFFPSSRDIYTFILNCFYEKAYKFYQFFLMPLCFQAQLLLAERI